MAVGKKTGGRKPGTPNRATQALQAAVASTGITPVALMLWNMREHHADALKLKRRAAATKDEVKKAVLDEQRHAAMDRAEVSAKRVADFIHPKLQSIMHAQDPENQIRVVHSVDNDTLARMATLIRFGATAKLLASPAKVG